MELRIDELQKALAHEINPSILQFANSSILPCLRVSVAIFAYSCRACPYQNEG
jgi:hypothetical protein